MDRRLIAPLAGVVAALALSSVALAGGWATIVPDETLAPIAGEPTDIGFTVMQHGETPASFVSPSVLVTPDGSSGPGLVFPATRAGDAGHFVATVTIPEAGAYTWAVTMPDLQVMSAPLAFTVAAGPAGAPAAPPTVDEGFAAPALAAETDRLRGEVTTMRVLVIALTVGLVAIAAAWVMTTWGRRRGDTTAEAQRADAIAGR
jgi:hypothetical protein